MYDSKILKTMKKTSKFNYEFFKKLTSLNKLRYMYNWFQWKEIEANQYKETDKAIKYFKLKKEVFELINSNSVLMLNENDELYNKKVNIFIRKIEMEGDFI